MKLTKLEYYELLKKTCLERGFPATSGNSLTLPMCVYRHPNTIKKCAVGILIPEEKFVDDMNGVGFVQDLLNKYPDCLEIPEGMTVDDLRVVQTIHDNLATLRWDSQKFLKRIKQFFGVSDLYEVLKFQNDLPNLSGYTYSEVMGWDAEKWESTHDFIQWLFPTDQPSQFNDLAPVLSKGEYNEISHVKILDAYVKFLEYVVNQSSFLKPNHNHLRTTRVFKSLALCNCRATQFEFLHELYKLKWFWKADFGGSWNYWVDQLKENS